MQATLLLTNEAETARLMLKEVTFSLCDIEARAGCTCDRWGHPCSGCVDRKIVPKSETPVSSAVKQ
jgi:hypothetical protein